MIREGVTHKYRRFRVLAAVILAAATIFFISPSAAVNAAAVQPINPIYLTQGDISQTAGGVTYTMRHDYAHPVVKHTTAYGDGYDRLLTIYLYITNQSGATLTYSALTGCTDANGTPLVNANALAGSEFGVIENGRGGCILAQFLVTSANDLSSITLTYNHMNYTPEYIADVNLCAAGGMTAEELAAKYPVTPLSFTVNTLSFQ